MASRRTTRTTAAEPENAPAARARTTGSNNNSTSAAGGPSKLSLGLKQQSKSANATSGSNGTAAGGLGGRVPRPVMGVKSSNTLNPGPRKRSALGDTTNGSKDQSDKTSFDKPKASTSTAAAPAPRKRYGTRSSTGGALDGDAVMRDSEEAVAAPISRPAIPRRASSTLSVTVGTSKGVSASAKLVRQRRVEAEAKKRVAEEELDAARRAEEEHRNKKPRLTSEPELDEEEEDEDLAGAEELEADEREKTKLRDEGWDDLDEGDEDDPLMVSTYVVEVYNYLRELELKTMPDPNYMDNQNEITWKMRGILVDWLVEIHTKFRLLPETIFLAVNIVDRLLSARVVSLVKFQLVGITALFIAAKYEEIQCPSIQSFHYMTDGGYTEDEILKAERYVLAMLDFDLSYPNPIHFLRRISKADGYDIHARTMAKYLMEISIVDHKFIATTPSLIAAAGSWLARKILQKGAWSANLIHYSGYTEDELKPTAQLMLDYVVRSSNLADPDSRDENPLHEGAPADLAEHINFTKKYAAKKFFKASSSVRQWAESEYAPLERFNRQTRKIERTLVPAVL